MLGTECGNNDFRICGKDIEIQLSKYLMFIGNAFITCHYDRKERYINISTIVTNMISSIIIINILLTFEVATSNVPSFYINLESSEISSKWKGKKYVTSTSLISVRKKTVNTFIQVKFVMKSVTLEPA